MLRAVKLAFVLGLIFILCGCAYTDTSVEFSKGDIYRNIKTGEVFYGNENAQFRNVLQSCESYANEGFRQYNTRQKNDIIYDCLIRHGYELVSRSE